MDKLQILLDQLSERLEELGLYTAVEKSRYILFSGQGHRARHVALDIKVTPTHRTKGHRFLEVVVD